MKYKGKKVLKGYSDGVVKDIKKFKKDYLFPVSGLLGLKYNNEISNDCNDLLDFISTSDVNSEIKLMEDLTKYLKGKAIFEQDIPTSDDKEPLYYLINPNIDDEGCKYLNLDEAPYKGKLYSFDNKVDNLCCKTQFTQEEIDKVPIFGLETVPVPDNERVDR